MKEKLVMLLYLIRKFLQKKVVKKEFLIRLLMNFRKNHSLNKKDKDMIELGQVEHPHHQLRLLVMQNQQMRLMIQVPEEDKMIIMKM